MQIQTQVEKKDKKKSRKTPNNAKRTIRHINHKYRVVISSSIILMLRSDVNFVNRFARISLDS